MTEVNEQSARYVIRLPRQARSKESWRRILDAGREIIEEGGATALTLSVLCERAQVAPTTIYQRVDSMGGLLFAIFQDRLAALKQQNLDQIAEVMVTPERTEARVRSAIHVVGVSFRSNANFLRTITEYSVADDAFWTDGDESADAFVAGITAALSFGDDAVAKECTHFIFSENMVRIMFGTHWMGSTKESESDFEERLFRMVWARLNFELGRSAG